MKTLLRLLVLTLIFGGAGMTLTACSAAAASPTPLPTLALQAESSTPQPGARSGSGISASGRVIPAQEVILAFGAAGRIQPGTLKEGQNVSAGELLLALDNAAAALEREQAARSLREMTSPAALAQAQIALANAQKAEQEALNKVQSLEFQRASDTRVENLQAQIDLAAQALARAQEAAKLTARLPEGDTRRASAQYAVTQAQLNLNALNAEYNYLTGKPTETDAALIRAQYEAAKAASQEATWYLAALRGETLPPEASGAQLAALQAAQAGLRLAEERLAAASILAPFDGQVVRLLLRPGEYAQPGAPALQLSDISTLQVETTDLSERDVPFIVPGQKASVSIDALGGNLPAEVLWVSPVASTLGGDVVYRVVLRLQKPYPEGLRSGMSAVVRFE